MKTCTKCHQSFPATLEYFCSNKRVKSGLTADCRQCIATWKHRWYKQNFPRIQKSKNTPEALKKRRNTYAQKPEHFRTKQKRRSETRVSKIPVRKKCAKCHIIKWAYEFGFSSHYTTGLRSYCLECHRKDNLAYAKNNWPIYRTSRDKRRAKRKGAIVREKITLEKLAGRDNWICHICHKTVKQSNWSCDHLIPLSQGGQHTWLNVALAHRLCNVRRGAGRIPAQLRLLGDLSLEAPTG